MSYLCCFLLIVPASYSIVFADQLLLGLWLAAVFADRSIPFDSFSVVALSCLTAFLSLSLVLVLLLTASLKFPYPSWFVPIVAASQILPFDNLLFVVSL